MPGQEDDQISTSALVQVTDTDMKPTTTIQQRLAAIIHVGKLVC